MRFPFESELGLIARMSHQSASKKISTLKSGHMTVLLGTIGGRLCSLDNDYDAAFEAAPERDHKQAMYVKSYCVGASISLQNAWARFTMCVSQTTDYIKCLQPNQTIGRVLFKQRRGWYTFKAFAKQPLLI